MLIIIQISTIIQFKVAIFKKQLIAAIKSSKFHQRFDYRSCPKNYYHYIKLNVSPLNNIDHVVNDILMPRYLSSVVLSK